MNYKKRNIAAFTIWEALVAMIITSVIITLSYKMYLSSTRTIHLDQKKQSDLEEMILFEKSLYREINRSEYLFTDGDLIYLESLDLWVIESRDSIFRVCVNNDKLMYEYKIENLSIGYLDSISDIITNLNISIFHQGIIYQMNFNKTYSNAFKLEHKQNEHNFTRYK